MANIALTNGERYTFARQGNVTVITDSTDSAESTKFINNNLTLSGSESRKLLIETENTANDAYVHFKSSGVNFSVGVRGIGDTFTIGRNTSLTTPGSSFTALRIPNQASPQVHFDHGIVVSGSAKISNDAFDATSYSYIMTNVATGSTQTTTWSIPSNTADRMFYVHSAEQYTGANITGGNDYLQIKTHLTGKGTIAWSELRTQPHYNHSFLIPAGIACTVTFIKGTNTIASTDYFQWLGHSIKLGR
jgi:hypothetical protein